MARAWNPFRRLTFVLFFAALAACGGSSDNKEASAGASSTEIGESQQKAPAAEPAARPDEPATLDAATADDGLYAVLHTTLGDVVCRLHYDKTPATVANFIALAEGGQRWLDPQTDEWTTRPLYRDVKFHRVIKDFMCQAGDPAGDGTGGPGYQFGDEFDPSLTHDGPGVLSMANRGPGTNGSQFFITHKAAEWLDNKHTVFGRVVMGQGVVDAMADVALEGPQRSTPVEDILLTKVDFVRRGEAAEAFDPTSHLGEINAAIDAKIAFRKDIEAEMKTATKTDSGLMYIVTQKGEGAPPAMGDRVVTHYDGYFLDGTKFDSSRERNVPFTTVIGVGQVIKGWDEAFLQMVPGERRRLIVPGDLAYGEQGYAGAIPPNATLVFDVELIEIQRSGQ